MKPHCARAGGSLFLLVATVIFFPYGCTQEAPPPQSLVERGKYLVMAAGCNHCHSPKVLTPMGPVPDTTRLLSGAPAGNPIPQMPKGVLAADQFAVAATADLTTWIGPWGVSFAYNLTPDPATGIGNWTEDLFINTLRSGKFMGQSRDILPPMPWQDIGRMSDDDLKAMFAYLKSLKPINNPIPAPIPPSN
jgi:hypothetical protein